MDKDTEIDLDLGINTDTGMDMGIRNMQQYLLYCDRIMDDIVNKNFCVIPTPSSLSDTRMNKSNDAGKSPVPK
jgi:hypothetical protein